MMHTALCINGVLACLLAFCDSTCLKCSTSLYKHTRTHTHTHTHMHAVMIKWIHISFYPCMCVLCFRYDVVLQTGLPDWKQPVFYYRRVRKLGLTELAVILLLILTVGHYLVLWATYLERRYVVVSSIYGLLLKHNLSNRNLTSSHLHYMQLDVFGKRL